MIAAQPTDRHTDAPGWQRPVWQQELAQAVHDPLELLALLDLKPAQLHPPQTAESLRAASRTFGLRVPRSYIRRMRRGDPRDPLLAQVLSSGAELADVPGFNADPLAESAARRAPDLLHKYQGRALLITTGACAVHCRYCFRRHFDYQPEPQDSRPGDSPRQGPQRWTQALDIVRNDASITELILSGGDPLSLSNARLTWLLEAANAIGHLQRIRLHTRTPIVLPSRVDSGLLQALQAVRGDLIIVVHTNHSAELSDEVCAALRALRETSKLLLNQTVLLAGVNDDADTLASLSQRLFDCGVLPYYLHQLDHVAGAAHFEVPDARALELQAAVNARLPGYLVPKLVREVAGAPAKLPLPPPPARIGPDCA
ncbi:MAG: EF-P beta-lysylation protein EpmB [Nevskiaceae bacterium]|jgi:EF-P beta-lysylation protein EpmB|nr:EF-P beta-lysylation protein EpmB [Nevskiaceae bacterium]